MQENILREAIRSVLAQDFHDFELLIVDDGSSDDTRQVIAQFSDERIRLLAQENKGISAALNAGLLAARGGYIARFDADDICFPQRLSRQVGFLDAHPAYVLTGERCRRIYWRMESTFLIFIAKPIPTKRSSRNWSTPALHSFRGDVPEKRSAGSRGLFAICAYSRITLMGKTGIRRKFCNLPKC